MAGMRDLPMVWLVALATAVTACSFRGPSVSDDARIPGDDAPGDDAPRDDAAIDAPTDGPIDGWWNPAWPRRRPITIRNTELTGPVQGFPILVRLPASVLAVANTGGNDLRFVTAAPATVLPYEIDTASPPADVLVWVRMPALAPTGPAPALWVYYGNAAAPAGGSGAAVFGSLYTSVHHLGAALDDATGRNHTAVAAGGGQTPTLAAGQIGGGRDFDGQNDYLTLAGNEADFDFTASLSVSAWIRVENLGPEYQAIVTKGDSSWRLHRHNQTEFIGFGTNTPTPPSTNQNSAGDMAMGDGGWHHVAIVYGGSMKRIFVDGTLDQTDTVPNATINTNSFAVAIGRNAESSTGGERLWNGEIDEVRISSAARDAHWMFAEHHTARDPDFVTPGPEETAPP
jgi:biopolymer transport protein ExbB